MNIEDIVVPKRLKSDLARLRFAMQTLEAMRFIARLNFSCCSSCGWYALGNPVCDEPGGVHGVCFTNEQAHRRCFQGRSKLLHALYFQWSGDAATMTAVIEKCGFKTQWDGTQGKCFAVLPSE